VHRFSQRVYAGGLSQLSEVGFQPIHLRICFNSSAKREFAHRRRAAAIANLDLVITVDTAVAHLAGALGKPVWILLPFFPDFRWLLDRSDGPWDPSARLFRQPSIGDWDSVMEAVQDALSAQFAELMASRIER